MRATALLGTSALNGTSVSGDTHAVLRGAVTPRSLRCEPCTLSGPDAVLDAAGACGGGATHSVLDVGADCDNSVAWTTAGRGRGIGTGAGCPPTRSCASTDSACGLSGKTSSISDSVADDVRGAALLIAAADAACEARIAPVSWLRISGTGDALGAACAFAGTRLGASHGSATRTPSA